MKRKRLIWQIFPSYLLITIFTLIAVTWYASSTFKKFHLNQTSKDLKTNARLASEQIQHLVLDGNFSKVDSLSKILGGKTILRITVILPNGKVIADSKEDPAKMDNHSDRPEIIEAASGKDGISIRYSHTLQQNMMYRAIPMYGNNVLIGSVRTSISIYSVEQALRNIYSKIVLAGMLISLLAALISLLVSRRISQPLDQIKKGAQKFAKGDFGGKLIVPETEEIGTLAETMNEMAKELNHKIETITKQRNEQKAVFSSMIEGVLAVDMDEVILNINKAAADFLSAGQDHAIGKSIREVIRNTELNSLVSENLQTGKALDRELTLFNNEERYIKVHITTLQDEKEKSIGSMIVLNDITELKRLESVRRDFVANVSHELRTPITSIKGFTETLLNGAMENKKDAAHFLNIIQKQSDRLNAIIEDLLSLSRIEQQDEKSGILFEQVNIFQVIQNAIEVCGGTAKKKEIDIKLDCESNLESKVNAPLLEEAIVNLIDNAIKYSHERSVVNINAAYNERNELKIDVIDQGVGIEEKHLSRLFERFYRIDKARSRKLGGTGLGLAIVKHITLAHGGRVDVKSTPGQGSTFSIYLPF